MFTRRKNYKDIQQPYIHFIFWILLNGTKKINESEQEVLGDIVEDLGGFNLISTVDDSTTHIIVGCK